MMRPFLSIVSSAAFSVIMLSLLSHGRSSAQLTPRGLGMGLAYTAVARGVHAADWNPANLGLTGNPSYSVSIFSASAGVGNNSFSIGTYNKFAPDPHWDTDEVAELMACVPDDGLSVDALAEARVLSFSAGRFAFSITALAGASARLDRTALEIPLEGTRVGETYRFDDMDATSMALGTARLSYGAPVRVSFADTFAVGGSLHLDVGGGYGHADTSRLNLTIGTFGFNIDGRYAGRAAAMGRGWGADIGAAARTRSGWTISAGLVNLVGSMRWKKDVKYFGGFVSGDSVGVLDFGDEDDEDEGKSVKAVQDSSWETDGKAFSRKAPVELHAGVLYEEGPYSVAADYVQGFGNLGWVTTRPRIAVGTEWRKVRWLPLRIGVAVGGRIGFGTSFGFGFRPGKFALDVGVMNRGFIFPSSSKGVFLGIEAGVGL
ncbi:hypothetical protein JW777_01625 [bacterium]|nr:hypothetical protein [bacterium]